MESWRARLGAVAIAVLAMGVSTTAWADSRPVDLALVLAIDVSGSVNADRYDLQRRGYAAAFASRDVADAIAAGENHVIAVTLVEWSGIGHQQQVIGWTILEDAASAAAFGSAIAETPRVYSDWTSISGAIDFSMSLFAQADVEPMRRVIDISGDGTNNNGRALVDARDEALKQGVTINGLPILTEYPQLDAYYRDNVIGGPNSFVVAADDFNSFGSAILGKLVREIADRKGPRMMTVALQ